MRLPDPLLVENVRGQVRKSAKRSGREPGVCGFESHSGQSKGVRSRRLTAKAPGLQLGDGGSIPSGVIVCLIRKVAGYGWPDRTANAVLDER